ncbi:MAG TPA: hypothetical protein VH395_08945 [Jatrophihabitantaceae bacterium]|jgi:hypothetical protein
MSVEAAARRYVRAHRQLYNADASGLADARFEIDDAFHELSAALGEPCIWCEQGDCPYAEMLDELDDDYYAPQRVPDPAGLLNEPTAS